MQRFLSGGWKAYLEARLFLRYAHRSVVTRYCALRNSSDLVHLSILRLLVQYFAGLTLL